MTKVGLVFSESGGCAPFHPFHLGRVSNIEAALLLQQVFPDYELVSQSSLLL